MQVRSHGVLFLFFFFRVGVEISIIFKLRNFLYKRIQSRKKIKNNEVEDENVNKKMWYEILHV